MKSLFLTLLATVFSTLVFCQNPNWSVNSGDFNNSMTVVAVAELGGTELRSASNEIGAFVGTELRGTTSAVYVSSKDRYFFLITIYSDLASGETITFKIYNESADEVVDLVNTTDFTLDLILGELDNPVVLSDDLASIDVTGPVATITSLTSDPTNQSSFSVSVSFDEDVNNFALDDVMAENAVLSSFNGSDANYSFTVTPSSDGVVEISLEAGTFNDVTGNLNLASEVFSRLYYSDLIYTSSGWSNTIGPDATSGVVMAFDLNTVSLNCNNLYVAEGTGLVISVDGNLLAGGNVVNDGSILINSGASFVNDSYSGNGTFTYQRNTTYDIGQGRYSFIGSPVADHDLGSTTGGFKFSYDEASDTYLDASGVTSMVKGVGYTIANNDVIDFTGTPNSGSIFVPVTNNGNGFNLVANPYPAAISYTDFMAQNLFDAVNNPLGSVSGTIYIWDDGDSRNKTPVSSDFLTINAMGFVSGGNSRSANYQGFIPTAQGFIVESIDGAGGAILFRNTMKLDGNNGDAGFFRAEEDIEKIKFKLSDEVGNASQMLVGFSEKARPERDYKYDALKTNGLQGIGLYSLGNDETQYAIQLVDYKGTNIGFNINAPGKYTIEKIEEDLKEERLWFLWDNETGESTDIMNQDYTFFAEKANSNRFKLFSTKIGEIAKLTDIINVNATETSVSIIGQIVNDNADLSIYDLSGKVLFQDKIDFVEGKANVPIELMANVLYIAKINTESVKFMIK